MEKAVIVWLCRMDGKHPAFAECHWGNHIRFIIWETEKGRKDFFSALVWLFALGDTEECWFCNILASITVAVFTVNEFGVTYRSGRVMCGR
jgi:hypothetical protein